MISTILFRHCYQQQHVIVDTGHYIWTWKGIFILYNKYILQKYSTYLFYLFIKNCHLTNRFDQIELILSWVNACSCTSCYQHRYLGSRGIPLSQKSCLYSTCPIKLIIVHLRQSLKCEWNEPTWELNSSITVSSTCGTLRILFVVLAHLMPHLN